MSSLGKLKYLAAFFGLSGCLVINGCGHAEIRLDEITRVSQADVKTTTNIEQLQLDAIGLSQLLQDKPPEKYPQQFAYLNDIYQRLTELKRERVIQKLDSARMSFAGDYQALVPLPAIERIRADVAQSQVLPEEQFLQVVKPLELERAATKKAISRFQQEEQQPDLNAERRATVYHHLYTLEGKTSWQTARDKQMEIIINTVRSARDKGYFNELLEAKVDFVRSIYPQKPAEVVAEMLNTYADIYAYRFQNAVKRRELDAAVEEIKKLQKKKDFIFIREKMRPTLPVMLNDFATAAGAEVDYEPATYQVYSHLKQDQAIREILEQPKKKNPATTTLTQRLAANQSERKKQGRISAALGYATAMSELHPSDNAYAKDIEQLKSSLLQAAKAEVQTNAFQSRFEQYEFGTLIADELGKFLQETLPEEIQIHTKPDSNSDYEINGYVLAAKVERREERGKKMLQVAVGQDRLPNPAYIDWLKLPEKERAKKPAPAETLLVEKTENIAITTAIITKTGTFAVSYKLQDLVANKVAFADSITLQKEFHDEAHNGLEVGKEKIPYKEADLPEDGQILQELAQESAAVIGKNIAAILQNPERELLGAAEEFIKQNNCSAALESLGMAYALIDAKQGDVSTVLPRLQEQAMSCE